MSNNANDATGDDNAAGAAAMESNNTPASTRRVSAERLIAMKDNIEALSRIHQAEVLRICTAGGVVGSENKNGVFINLTSVSEPTVSVIERYLAYVSTQETQLNEVEMQKKELTTKYFT
jgi:hypothetical protein